MNEDKNTLRTQPLYKIQFSHIAYWFIYFLHWNKCIDSYTCYIETECIDLNTSYIEIVCI